MIPTNHTVAHPSAPANPGRRELVVAILAWAGIQALDLSKGVIGNALYDGLKQHKSSGLRLDGLSLVAPNTQYVPRGREYADLAYQLFLSSAAAANHFRLPDHWTDREGNIIPPNVTLANGVSTYGHEASVFKDISDFVRGELAADWNQVGQIPNSPAPHSETLLGSGASNWDTAMILGHPTSPRFDHPACHLSYAIGQRNETVKRWQYSKVVTEPIKTIVDRHGKTLHAGSQAGNLTDDYLLVTRLPGRESGTTLTIFSGLHGPGTRSTSLLFNCLQLSQLRKLADHIEMREGEVPHFQAIFRASHLQRNLAEDKTDSDCATKIELVTEGFPPVRLKTI